MQDINSFNAREIREAFRGGTLSQPTPGLAPGSVQANLVILPQSDAFDFLLFCTRNPKPCPILDVTEVGDWEPRQVAPGADLRTDVPLYRVWKSGILVDEVTDIRDLWQEDFVGFLLGCSFSFEAVMLAAGLPVRHIEEGKNVPMYQTTIPCQSAGRFSGNMVVSMRPLTPKQAIQAVEVTGRFAKAHGAPLHFGNPERLGIENINAPDFGEAVTIREDEIPVFWACGVTPQLAIMKSHPELAITHAPGYMFITDVRDEELTFS
ncbi:putative hydro-lyase [Sodalinema gerasimenkoae]|uniref:putative hydro-lyase n=1 Tax=Sodalinema gerasimenkoae TaxID=2862348 RepID=UPI001356D212|nr:putative hydro-lyase [Sodalinema gerasimenkoae]